MKVSYLLFFLIILFAGFIRFYQLGVIPHGLYIDEVSIGKNAYDILKTGKDEYGVAFPILFKSLGDYKLPLYIYAVSGTMALFGKTDFAVRFPSAMFGTLTVGVVYFLLYQLLRYKNTMSHKNARNFSFLAMVLLAILPWHFHFSRAGFEVTVAVFLYVSALTLGIAYFTQKKLGFLIGSSICFLLTMYTYHSYTVIAPITCVMGACVLYKRLKKERKRLLAVCISALLLSIPIVIASLSPTGESRFAQTSAFVNIHVHTWIARLGIDTLIFLKNYSSYFSLTYLFRFGDQINRHQVQNLPPVYLWQLPVMVAGIYYLLKSKNTLLKTVTFFLIIIAPIPASLALPSPHTLRVLLASIATVILTVCGLILITKSQKKLLILIPICVVATMSFLGYTHFYFIHYPADSSIDWGGEYTQLIAQVQKDHKKYPHIIVDTSLPNASLYFSYYAPSLRILYTKPGQATPKGWVGQTLYARPFFVDAHPSGLLENIYFQNTKRDIFAQIIHL